MITHKIAYLIGECGYKPSTIAAITFTNKAAREMQERVAKLLQGNTTGPDRHHLPFAGPAHPAPGREARRLQTAFLDSRCRRRAGITHDILKTTDKKEIRRAQSRISLWKNALISPAAALQSAEDDNARAYAKIYDRYDDTLRAYQAVDFDDLIRLPVELFGHPPRAARKVAATACATC